jgi:integrase
VNKNPLRSVRKPSIKRREAILTGDQDKSLLDATRDEEFRDFLIAVYETGARPGQVMGLTAQDVDFGAGLWVVKHKIWPKRAAPGAFR